MRTATRGHIHVFAGRAGEGFVAGIQGGRAPYCGVSTESEDQAIKRALLNCRERELLDVAGKLFDAATDDEPHPVSRGRRKRCAGSDWGTNSERFKRLEQERLARLGAVYAGVRLVEAFAHATIFDTECPVCGEKSRERWARLAEREREQKSACRKCWGKIFPHDLGPNRVILESEAPSSPGLDEASGQ